MTVDGSPERETMLRQILVQLLISDAIEVRPALTYAARVVAEVLEAESVAILLYPSSRQLLQAPGSSEEVALHREAASRRDDLSLAAGDQLVSIVHRGPSAMRYASAAGGQAASNCESAQHTSQFDVAGERRGILEVLSPHPCQLDGDPVVLQSVARWIGVIVERAECFERLIRQGFESGRREGFDDLIGALTRQR